MGLEEIIEAIEQEAMRHLAMAKLADIGGAHARQAERLRAGAELLRTLVDDGRRVDKSGQVDKGAQVGKMGTSGHWHTFGQSDRENGTGETAPAPEMTPANDTAGVLSDG